MDEAEAGAIVVMCYKCLGTCHTYKRCTTTSYACNAPPTGSMGSSATSGPSQAPSGCGRGRGRRTNVGFRWSTCNVRAFNFGICNIWTIFVVWTYAWNCIVIIELIFVLFCWWLFYSFSIIMPISVILLLVSDCSDLVLQVCSGLLRSWVGLGLPHEEEGQCRDATGDQHSYVLLQWQLQAC
jgi:hypothetical protein